MGFLERVRRSSAHLPFTSRPAPIKTSIKEAIFDHLPSFLDDFMIGDGSRRSFRWNNLFLAGGGGWRGAGSHGRRRGGEGEGEGGGEGVEEEGVEPFRGARCEREGRGDGRGGGGRWRATADGGREGGTAGDAYRHDHI